jgi:uncharacterized protein
VVLSPLEVHALAELRCRLVARFGPRLVRMTLFGSRARGEGRGDSDIDVLVLVDGLSPAERRSALDDALEVELETGLVLSPLVRCPEAMPPESALARELARDGVHL